MDNPLIILAGATGNLGGRIARELLERGTRVKAIVRHSSASDKVAELQKLGAEIAVVDYSHNSALGNACKGGSCIVSALAGLRDTIVEAQTLLLNAAVKAGVPRFIPSDFSIDFTKLSPGTNRNLDLRREFHEHLEKTPIAATSILNGMFADLLTGQAPYILFKFKRVIYWENADQMLDFTAIDDIARFTAEAALDPSTPRYLRIAGDQISAHGLAEAASEVTGKKFRLLRAGSLKRLAAMIKIMPKIIPGKDKLYPPWQGMQYMRDMFSGLAKLEPLDNDRYPGMKWTSVREVLANR